MSRRVSKRKSVSITDDEDQDDSASISVDGTDASARSKRRSIQGSTQEVEFTLSQQLPEAFQSIADVKEFERSKLLQMNEENKNKTICDMSRLLLFKALAGETIDRAKCAKEIDITKDRISSAVWDAAATNLKNVFGFELSRVPKCLENSLSKKSKFKDRHYVLNTIKDDDGSHSNQIHSHHVTASVEKGFLMLILAFIFCKGEGRKDGSRWITDIDLYRLLHGADESLPRHPPVMAKRKPLTGQPTVTDKTPNADVLIKKFTDMDYLLSEKSEDAALSQGDYEPTLYSMGPRAAMEIGRKQIVYFCAEILGESEPDPTMLAEISQAEATEASQATEV